jgi:hypothetical protein
MHLILRWRQFSQLSGSRFEAMAGDGLDENPEAKIWSGETVDLHMGSASVRGRHSLERGPNQGRRFNERN